LARLDQPRPGRLAQILGQPPSLTNPPPGCRFAPRCPHVFEKCDAPPPLVDGNRCWLEPEQKRVLREVDGRIGLRGVGGPNDRNKAVRP
jgi:ABC-type dipeptide/oligopeptide/nickel transport system ATPase component